MFAAAASRMAGRGRREKRRCRRREAGVMFNSTPVRQLRFAVRVGQGIVISNESANPKESQPPEITHLFFSQGLRGSCPISFMQLACS